MQIINKDQMIEIFKDIEGYENLYQVSNLGNVKSLGNGGSNASKERILKPTKNQKGYLYVGLCKEGKRKKCKIHRLVASVFIDNPNNFTEINHKDEDKTNNHFTNLEWCTHFYNMNYGTRIQRVADKLSKQVLCVETGRVYPSANEVERQLGFSQGNISRCCAGRYKQAYGYTWQYVE